METKNPLYDRHDMMDARHKNILLADDNEGDIELFIDAIQEGDYPHSLYVVRDGEDVLEFLRTVTPLPDIIVLDINMPRMNGDVALEEIKKNPQTQNIPVIMLTSSQTTGDIERAKNLGANGYMVKPANCDASELTGLLPLLKDNPDLFLHVGAD